MKGNGQQSLAGRVLYIHPMTQAGARLLAAVYRSMGVETRVLSHSDERTLELGAMYSSGEECFPEKITLGDYLKVTEKEGFDPSKTAFLMPNSTGPCRFGQYWPLLDTVLSKLGLQDIMIVNPSSENGYGGSGKGVITFFRSAWIGFVASDILRKMLLKTRPYEKVKGATDRVYEESLQHCERILEREGIGFGKRTSLLNAELARARTRFRSIDAEYVKGKPLIAVIGEIFCRHNRFANENMLRKLEEHGAETWIADVGEWIFYTDWSHRDNLRRIGKKYSGDMSISHLKTYIMRRDEHKLLKSFHEEFKGYEEPENVDVVTELTEDYLPATGALGEMALSLGRSCYSHAKGVDGIVDISPFSCMNGIVSEAIYPSFSKDHDDIPCRVFYYDGVNRDLDRDIGIFMELVKGYMGRKKIQRVYPDYFREK